MSKMSEYHSDLEAIKRVMDEPVQDYCTCGRCRSDQCPQCVRLRDGKEEPEPAEVQIERKVDWLVRELDELCALANNPETRDLVAKEAIGVGQIQFRAGLILSFLAADKPSLRMVSNVR